MVKNMREDRVFEEAIVEYNMKLLISERTKCNWFGEFMEAPASPIDTIFLGLIN